MNIRRAIITIFILLFLGFTSFAQYQLTKNTELAWEAILDMRFNEADSLMTQELMVNPTNYYAVYLQQTTDAFRFMISMSDSSYIKVCDNYKRRLYFLEGKDDESPYYNSCIAEMKLQVGMFNIIYGERLTGLRKAYGAYKMTYRNIDKFPKFNQSYKLDGIFNVAISNMPPFVSWAVSFFGVSGSYKEGYDIMEGYYNEYKSGPLKAEAALYNILAFKLNRDPFTAYKFFDDLPEDFSRYKLLRYLKGNIAYRTGHNEEGLEIISGLKPEENGFYFNGYNYMMGKILLRKLDTNCRGYFQKFLNNQLEDQYHKEINYRLAMSYLMEGDISGFKKYKELSEDNGNEITERDREAVCDYELDYIPDENLLRARLLLDGGYQFQAEAELYKWDIKSKTEIQYMLEYYFLAGRLEYLKNDYSKAEECFSKVLEMGRKENYSYASHSALYLGYIFENSNREKAIEYFKRAESLWESGYYEYIKDFAKKKIEAMERKVR